MRVVLIGFSRGDNYIIDPVFIALYFGYLDEFDDRHH
jgi:hypothetical protein